MSDHFNELSRAEAERLALLAEECGEIVQAVGKILRHGYNSRHPDGGPTNRQSLEREIGDIDCAIKLLREAGDISRDEIRKHSLAKQERVGKYLHHQADAMLAAREVQS